MLPMYNLAEGTYDRATRRMGFEAPQVRSQMRLPEGPVQSSPEGVVWQGSAASRSVAVPVAGSVGALLGVVIGSISGSALLDDGVIPAGTSSGMAPAIVATLAGGLGWLIGAIACMIAYRQQGPPTREETKGLVITAFAFAFAGLLLAAVMLTFQDAYKDPRTFYLQRLIWLDAGLAAVTCLLVAQRGWKPSATIVAMTLIGAVSAAVAVSQFRAFLEACDPMILLGEPCRTSF